MDAATDSVLLFLWRAGNPNDEASITLMITVTPDH